MPMVYLDTAHYVRMVKEDRSISKTLKEALDLYFSIPPVKPKRKK